MTVVCCLDRYSENLTIYNTLENTMLQIGSIAELVCLAIANDITRLESFYNRAGFQDLDDNMRGPMSTTSTNIDCRYTLFIYGVREDDAGDYLCLIRDFVTGLTTVLDMVPFTISVFGECVHIIYHESISCSRIISDVDMHVVSVVKKDLMAR